MTNIKKKNEKPIIISLIILFVLILSLCIYTKFGTSETEVSKVLKKYTKEINYSKIDEFDDSTIFFGEDNSFDEIDDSTNSNSNSNIHNPDSSELEDSNNDDEEIIRNKIEEDFF